MQINAEKNIVSCNARRGDGGFTLIEVIVAGSLMIILSVGTLTVFTHAVRINRGNNLRSQAHSILQQEVEYFRSIRFSPGLGTHPDLVGGPAFSRPKRFSADVPPREFNVVVDVDNLPAGTTEADCKFKQIKITATPVVAETDAWLSNANLGTNVIIHRVKGN